MVVADEVVDLDEIVAGYESARANDPAADLADHLPARDHPLYRRALPELVRVDMELAWSSGQPRRVSEYLQRFPDLRDDTPEICFEEYRLRQQAGEDPDPVDYQSLFGINTTDWPRRRGGGYEGMTASAAAYLKKNQSTAVNHATDIGNGATEDPPTLMFDQLHGVDPKAATSLAEALTKFPKVGEKFLGYQLIDELGRGAFSRVYLALESAVAGRRVALKVTGDARLEIYALAGLRHTNIIPVYSVQRSGPYEAIVMPHCGNVTLADVTKQLVKDPAAPPSGQWLADQFARNRHTPLLDRMASSNYPDAVLELAIHLAEGLAHAHDRGIWHRDLKPANVLLADDGEPLLLDFNLAESDGPGGLPVAAYVGGTLPYMAPEQIRAFTGKGPAPDARADIYAFGLILYELLGRRPATPMPTGRLDEILAQLARDRAKLPIDLRLSNQDVSPALASIISKCLQPNPSDRYANARELLEDLTRQRDHQPLRFAPEPSMRERAGKWAKRHPRLTSGSSVTVIAAAMMVALGMTTWSIHRDRSLLAERDNVRQFHDELRSVKIALTPSTPDPELVKSGQALALRAWHRFPEEDKTHAADRGMLAYLYGRSEKQRITRAENPEERQRLRDSAIQWTKRAEKLFGNGPRASAARAQLTTLSKEDASADGGEDDFLAGLTLLDQRKPREARMRFEKATRQHPESMPIWFARGNAAQTLGRHDEAIECFSACVALAPDVPNGYHGRAITLLALRRFDEALLDMQRAVELAPESLQARIDRGLVFLELKKWKEAEDDITFAIDGDYPETRLHFLRARIRERAGNKIGADADRQKGFTLPPRSENDWLARCVQRMQSDPQRALSEIEDCLSRHPDWRRIWENKATILSEYLHRPEDAIAALTEVIRLDPEYATAYAGRGVIYARLGDFAAARRDAVRARELSDGPDITYQVAGIYALTAKDAPADRDRALFLLSRAIHQGYGLALIDIDPELVSVRTLPEVKKLVNEAKNMQTRLKDGG